MILFPGVIEAPTLNRHLNLELRDTNFFWVEYSIPILFGMLHSNFSTLQKGQSI